VSLVGAGPGDPDLWTVRALQRVASADLVLYDALVDASPLRAVTKARCFCVGKRAGRASVKQETINRLMIRAAQQGKRVVRLKGGDPFVFGRGAEEAIALTMAGVPFEVVPGVTAAVAAPGLAGIPVTHRGVAAGFAVLAGHSGEALDASLRAVRPGRLTIVILMGVAGRQEIQCRLLAHGWTGDTPAALVCGASTADEWTWTGRLMDVGEAEPPEGVAGVMIVGEVVRVREALSAAQHGPDALSDEVKYGRS
jgi:uroporphyrin-III C-methyltransferase